MPAISEGERENVVASLVFSYWAEVLGHQRALLDGKRKARIVSRYRESRDPSELLFVVDGVRKSEFHRGASGTKYDGIETVFRDRAQVEKFAALGGHGDGKTHRMAEKYLGLSGAQP